MKNLLPDLIETERCRMRPFMLNDLPNLFLLYGDPKVMATRKIGVQNIDQTASQLKDFLKLWGDRGFGLYAVFEKDTGVFIGECGFRPYAPNQSDIIEISYGLRPQFWGNGIATEITSAMLDAGFNGFNDFNGFARDNIYAHAQSQNGASLGVLSKLGFSRSFIDPLELPSGLVRCELRQEEEMKKQIIPW